jgi:acetyl-CoA carboxylase carboxyl transferase subunit beta
MSWLFREKAPKPPIIKAQNQMPDDTWSKCPQCSAILFTKELRRNSGVCLKCSYHFRLTAEQRIPLLVDRHSYQPMSDEIRSADPLNFKDSKRYRDRIKKTEKDTGLSEAVQTGLARLNSKPIALAVFDFNFMGGSMGSAVGEKLARLIEAGIEKTMPVIIVSASGGARMQEGVFSLMQMAKVSLCLSKLGKAGLPYISVLTDPVTGGVAASFAMQGDVIISEPRAYIGFAGARVIEKTIRQQLPSGFQRAEFLLNHGIIDRIVERHNLRDEISKILRNFGF